MTVWGEVSFKVKRAITFMEEFTIGQLADMTGLEYQSVETVVQRLLKDGYITQAEPRQPERRKRVGRPRQTYALVNDSEVAKKLYTSIEAFQIEEALTAASDRKPSNAHFDAAVSTIDSLEAGEEEISAVSLDKAAERLDFARRYEEMIEEGIEIAHAYVDFQQARLEFLRGNRAESEKLLAQARSVFADFDLRDQVRLIDEYTLAIMLKKQLETLLQDAQRTPASFVEHFKETLKPLAHLTVSPALSSIILKVGEMVDTANQAKAKLTEENKQLRMRIDQLMGHPVELDQKPGHGAVLLWQDGQVYIKSYPGWQESQLSEGGEAKAEEQKGPTLSRKETDEVSHEVLHRYTSCMSLCPRTGQMEWPKPLYERLVAYSEFDPSLHNLYFTQYLMNALSRTEVGSEPYQLPIVVALWSTAGTGRTFLLQRLAESRGYASRAAEPFYVILEAAAQAVKSKTGLWQLHRRAWKLYGQFQEPPTGLYQQQGADALQLLEQLRMEVIRKQWQSALQLHERLLEVLRKLYMSYRLSDEEIRDTLRIWRTP